MRELIEQVRPLVNRPERWDFSGARELFAGVDIGTYSVVVVVVDQEGTPRACALRQAEVVRSGLILDYLGALSVVRELMTEIRARADKPIVKGATGYPPQTEPGNVRTTRYVLEGVDLEVLRVLDEPSAANLVLQIKDGAIVDVGGGTTGIAVMKDGRVIHSDDEATGGIHLSLVLAGGLKISLEEAERLKADKGKSREVLPLIRPVIDKISTIIQTTLRPYAQVREVCLVGGTCELAGLSEIVGQNLGLWTYQPPDPQIVTPLGIALSCLKANGDTLPE